MHMPEKIVHIFGLFPFMIQSITEDGEKTVKLNWARVLEALLIAVVGGVFASYLMLRDMRVEFELFKHAAEDNLHKIEAKIDKVDERVYEHMTAVAGGKNGRRSE